MHLGPEAAANVGRDHAQLVFGDGNGLGDPPTMHVRHLARHVDGQRTVRVWVAITQRVSMQVGIKRLLAMRSWMT
jgi:hypothetical protein